MDIHDDRGRQPSFYPNMSYKPHLVYIPEDKCSGLRPSNNGHPAITLFMEWSETYINHMPNTSTPPYITVYHCIPQNLPNSNTTMPDLRLIHADLPGSVLWPCHHYRVKTRCCPSCQFKTPIRILHPAACERPLHPSYSINICLIYVCHDKGMHNI